MLTKLIFGLISMALFTVFVGAVVVKLKEPALIVVVLAGIAMIDRRKRRQMPDWPALSRHSPLLGWPRGGLPLAPSLAGLALWAALLALHPAVIGVAPL